MSACAGHKLAMRKERAQKRWTSDWQSCKKNRPTRAHVINLALNVGLRIADLDILSVGMILDIVTLRGKQFHHRDMQ